MAAPGTFETCRHVRSVVAIRAKRTLIKLYSTQAYGAPFRFALKEESQKGAKTKRRRGWSALSH
jgi:hypothetical protein